MSARGSDYTVEEVARAWFVKMRGDEAEKLRGEFDAWLAAAPEHREAYERISRSMTESAILKTSSRFGSEAARRRRSGTPGRRMPWGAITAGALIVIAAVGVLSISPPGDSRFASSAQASEPLTTRRGEIRTFELPDGSTATLDTESRLELLYSAGERRVRLQKGRVRLTVAREGRPFIAETVADADVVQTDDAVFDLRLESGHGELTLLAGEAALVSSRTAGLAASGTRPIEAGEQVPLTATGGTVGPAKISLPPARSDWPTGWAEYDRISLGALVAEANRYATLPIIVDDPAIADLAVSGRFHLRDSDAFARRVADLFALTIDEQSDGRHLVRS